SALIRAPGALLFHLTRTMKYIYLTMKGMCPEVSRLRLLGSSIWVLFATMVYDTLSVVARMATCMLTNYRFRRAFCGFLLSFFSLNVSAQQFSLYGTGTLWDSF